MAAVPARLEKTLRALLTWCAGRVSPDLREEIALCAWHACADAGARGGSVAFARSVLGEIVDLLTLGLRVRSAPGVTEPSPTPNRGGSSMHPVDDIRRAVRRLRSNRGTLSLSVAMLALAIGVTTAMFTVLDALMLNPVPFRDAKRLTSVVIAKEKMFMSTAAPAALPALRASGAFAAVEGAAQAPVVLEGSDGLISQGGARVTPGLFDMLGVQPILGRSFARDEGRAGSEHRILLSEELWTTNFGRDPGIIGRTIRVSGILTEVIGVMPAGFRFPYSNSTTWRPLDFSAPPHELERLRPSIYARVKPGIPVSDAMRVADASLREVPGIAADEHAMFRPIAAGMLDSYSRRAVTALSVGVVLVFLVLCANAMNLMLTRLSARQREFGVCSALGASRARLIREAIAETALVGLAAALAGLALAAGLVQLAQSYLPAAFLSRTLTPVALSARALVATSILTLVAAAVAGIVPAWLATRVDASESLRGTSRGGTDVPGQRRLGRGLLVVEVALAAALLAGAAQLVRTFVNLTRADRGLDAQGVITAWISLPEFAFKARPARQAFASALDERLRQLPGVQQVSLSLGVPPGGGSIYFSPARAANAPNAPQPPPDVRAVVHAYSVSPQFFELFRIPIVAGRTFSTPAAEGDVILGEQFAKKLFPDGSPVGRSFTFEGHKTPYTVVGVAREIRSPSLDPLSDEPEMYHPILVMRDGRAESFGGSQIMVALRCGTGCAGLDAIRRVILDLSAQAMVVRLGPMEAEYLQNIARPRAAAALAACFALVALVASAGGLFGVLSAAVARRRREFGIRVALGIAPGRLTWLVLRQAFALSSLGLVFGIFGAWALSRALASLTFGVSPADPLSWAGVFGSLGLATLLAAWRPGRQAARIDPAELLRSE
jgi:putative ABC transport system permease protein